MLPSQDRGMFLSGGGWTASEANLNGVWIIFLDHAL